MSIPNYLNNEWNDPPEPTAWAKFFAFLLVATGFIVVGTVLFFVFGVYMILFPLPTLAVLYFWLR